MEHITHQSTVAIAAIFLFLVITTSSVLARPHVRPLLTLADLPEDGAIPQKEAADVDAMQSAPVPEIESDVKFDIVSLPSHFEEYDLNNNRRVSLLEVSIVTGTKEDNAILPFRAADTDHDGDLSYEEFINAPWIWGATQAEFDEQHA